MSQCDSEHSRSAVTHPMNWFSGNLVNKFRFLSYNRVQSKLIIRIFTFRGPPVASEVTPNEPDAAAEKRNKVIDEIGVTTLPRLVNDDFGFGPWVGVIVYFIIVPFTRAQLDGVASHCNRGR